MDRCLKRDAGERYESGEAVRDALSEIVAPRPAWVAPAGKAVRVHSQRLVSLVQRAVVVINYEVEPVDHSVPQ